MELFGTQKKPMPDYNKVIGPELLDYLVRIDSLETLGNTIRRDFTMKSLHWDSDTSELKRRIAQSRKGVEELRVKMDYLKKMFVETVELLRETGSYEDFESLNKRVDSWNFESFMTREEFQRLIEANL